MRKKVIFEDWLEKANLIWNWRYNYDEVKENWIDSRSKVPITCNQCGHRWLIKPSDHVAKSRLCGCPKCKYDDKRLDLNNLIKRFKKFTTISMIILKLKFIKTTIQNFQLYVKMIFKKCWRSYNG